MKRIISLITILCLVLGSFSFVFADEWGSSQISSVVNNVSSINSTLSNIYTKVNTITNYLYDSNHSIAYWTSAIASWMQPIYTALTSELQVNLGLDSIITGLNEVVSSGGSTTYYPYLKYNGKSNANWLSDIYTRLNTNGWNNSTGTKSFRNITDNGWSVYSFTPSANVLDNLMFALQIGFNNMASIYQYEYQHRDIGYNASQSIVNWADIDSTYTFTPSSGIDGLYKYLNSIQAPVARLSYVLASDERIEAQEAAAANEQAVVDNFIDSNGAGSASPSDIGSISDLSSGYQNNFGSSASVTGIFNIFDSNNFGWFSQETANQLDTSSNNSRAKSVSEFETPLLDKRIGDIYDALGVKP